MNITCPNCGDSPTRRVAGFSLHIENIKITPGNDPETIALDRDGEGGEFSLSEFAEVLHQFISDRL